MDWKRIKNPTRKLHEDPEVEKLLRGLLEKNIIPIMAVELDANEDGEPKGDSKIGIYCYGPSEWVAANIFQAVESHEEIKLLLGKMAALKLIKEKLLGSFQKFEKELESSQEGVDLFDLSKYDIDRKKPN